MAKKKRSATVTVLRREQVDSSAEVKVTGVSTIEEAKAKALKIVNDLPASVAWHVEGGETESLEADHVEWED